MGKSTNTCNNFLALLYNATPWANIADNAASSPITDIHFAVAKVTGAVGDTMSTNECDFTNYARQTMARSVAGWTAPASRATSNAAAITFPQCGVTGNTVVAAKTGKAAGASDVFHYGDLNAPVILSNLIRLVFDIGAVTITEN
jgi:hypothetical protein